MLFKDRGVPRTWLFKRIACFGEVRLFSQILNGWNKALMDEHCRQSIIHQMHSAAYQSRPAPSDAATEELIKD